MPITEASSGYLKHKGAVRVHGSLIVKTCKYQQPESPQGGPRSWTEFIESPEIVLRSRGNCSKYWFPLFPGCNGWCQPFFLSIMSFAQGSKSPEKVPGWLSWSHTFCYCWTEPGEAGPAHWATIGEHQHNYPRTIREEQWPQKEILIPFSGNGWVACGATTGSLVAYRILTTWINCPKQEVSQQVGKDPCWCLTWLWPFPGWASFLLWHPWYGLENPGGILCTYHQLITEMKLVI